MEVLPNIHVGNIYITLPEHSESCRDVHVEKSKCVVQLQSDQEVCLNLPRGTSLKPDVLPTVPRRYLYMVTMNTNQKLLICEEDLNLFHTGGNQKENQCKENLPEGGVAAKRTRRSGQTEMKLQAVFGVKLLYVEKEGDDEESGEWADSVHVHLIPCSDSFFSGVKALLDTTNSCLPENIRHVEKMKVGYIIK
ncbi:hypothetical protein E2C01_034899 [Portunus trituberculatus]|uniref:Uncharacterized protein n=1 Tax=Portunus trituberculatus TaxID=210409 RepID=A0A5B7F2R8_PORTR|nr:hypothetical protein [Portunus trituberculatus]